MTDKIESKIISSWKDFFNIKNNLYEFIATILVLIITLTVLTQFLNFIELRKGIVLPDPVLKSFNPVNLTWLTFFLIYTAIILGILSLIKTPQNLIIVIQSYIVMIFFRMIAMYILPLNPPDKMLLLSDPIVEYFGTGQNLTKDLFFSGHTATIFLLYITSQKKFLRKIFLSFTIAVAIALLLQHVHYSIDVFAAPFFAYVSYKIVTNLHFKNHNNYLAKNSI